MATTRKIALAFAGPGETTVENAADLLNDHLGFGPADADGLPEIPENLEFRLLFPVSEDHLSSGLQAVIDWTDTADIEYEAVIDPDAKQSRKVKAALKYAKHIHENPNVNSGLMDELRAADEEGFETWLVLLWGDDENGDDHAETLLDLASTYEIRALDLTKGLEDIAFAAEDEPLDKEPEPEKPKRSKRKPREELRQDDEPLADEPVEDVKTAYAAGQKGVTAEPGSLEEDVAQAKAKRDKAEPETKVDAALGIVAKALEVLQLTDRTNALLNVAGRVEYRPLTVALGEALETLQERLSAPQSGVGAKPDPSPSDDAEKPRRSRGRPRKDGTAAQPRSPEEKAVKEIWDDDEQDWVRAGRGRIPKGIKTRMVDPSTGEVVNED